jgi:hypothetical protein
MSPRASGLASHQTSEHQARAIRHDLQHNPRHRESSMQPRQQGVLRNVSDA